MKIEFETAHDIGDTVFLADAEEDRVYRVKIIGVSVESRLLGEPLSVFYYYLPVGSVITMRVGEDSLFCTPQDAFDHIRWEKT